MTAKKNRSTKPRSNSKLETLPDETQAEVFEASKSRSLDQTAAWIKERAGITVSTSAVSRFLSWYRLNAKSQSLGLDEETLFKILKRHSNKVDAEELDRYAEALSKINALRNLHPVSYMNVVCQRRRLQLEEIQCEQRNREIALAERRCELQISQAEKAEKITREPMSDEEKMQRIRELFNIGLEPEPEAA